MQVDEMLNAMIDAGITQQKIADYLEVDQSSVSRWANNQNNMKHNVAKKIEQLFKEKLGQDDQN
ncbi:helix-turn-helix domain-containing protein [Moraxella catarrhalis]|uniref:helix-turn-helix domain-containing protein n=1 Tax=Moraxella catarrhalis TaxID=480 RepID=UPI0009C38F76|nr:helix-turn-helix transcriptional regulator [Moraxella catarrhalis]ARE65438.1 hypothetical protein MC195_01180 [Moraxella catarrhalis]MPX23099.1 XRE family transcriptional regulator [Moraxella catarrhalis]RKL74606.1 XRE family transcriptional regulator [Moraxella catarrhalis]